ncbi:MAG: hypothetical protein HW378_3017 [Anaerolineales bacterium]|nr:hypothetical protein [Anaerolineales bacterium]
MNADDAARFHDATLVRAIRRGGVAALARLGWTRSSYLLLSAFVATLFVIIVVWWPLVVDYFATADPARPLWVQLDWLLLGVFAAMSLLIMSGANLKADALIVAVGLAGGLVIESWGTQTNLWTYYTLERPPLWIIPAWPIASLAIDRLYRLLTRISNLQLPISQSLYWIIFPAFYLLMLFFVWPTLNKSFTWIALLMALGLCALLILTPTDHRGAVLTFAAGTGLGYFLERWGTTRECWTYYTRETPPLFAVLAHGMAAVAFWRAGLLLKLVSQRVQRIKPMSTLIRVIRSIR